MPSYIFHRSGPFVVRNAPLLYVCMTYSGRVRPEFMSALLAALVSRGEAAYDPPGQTHGVLLYWRTPEAWGEALHEWVRVLFFFCSLQSQFH